jgi:hypothetical protein
MSEEQKPSDELRPVKGSKRGQKGPNGDRQGRRSCPRYKVTPRQGARFRANWRILAMPVTLADSTSVEFFYKVIHPRVFSDVARGKFGGLFFEASRERQPIVDVEWGNRQ